MYAKFDRNARICWPEVKTAYIYNGLYCPPRFQAIVSSLLCAVKQIREMPIHSLFILCLLRNCGV